MPVVIITDEQNLADVARRHLNAKTKAALTRAEAIITAANPDRSLDRLTPGDVLFIPRSARDRNAADRPHAAPGQSLDDLELEVKRLFTAATDARERTSVELRAVATMLDSPDLQAAARDPTIDALLKTTLQATREHDADTQADVARLGAAIGSWFEQLDAFQKRFE